MIFRQNPLNWHLPMSMILLPEKRILRKQQIDLFDKIEIDLKTLQYILGHADISVALNIHHMKFRYAEEEVYRIAKD